jgi:radical SAM protein with 4Fe4S-binding SPASM domain
LQTTDTLLLVDKKGDDVTTTATQKPYLLARQEDDGWLLFDVNQHSITKVTKHDVLTAERDGRVLRRIRQPMVAGALSAPLKLFVSVSNRCNLKCLHCMSASSPRGRIEPTTAELGHLADEAAEMGIFLVVIGGGEPFLRRDIWDIIAGFRRHSIGVSLTTNGTILDIGDINNILEYRVRMNVSIDGSEKTHDGIRRKKGAFARTVANIQRLKDSGITPTIRFTLMRSNLGDVDEVLALASRLDVPIKVRRAKPVGRVLEGSDIITEPTPEYFDAITRLNRASHCGVEDIMRLDGGSAKDQLLVSSNDCGAATRVMFVNEDRAVSPCVFLGKEYTGSRWIPGNLAELWRSAPEFVSLRTLQSNTECTLCPRRRVCHMECPAMRLHTGGSLTAKDPGCLKEFLENRVQES